MRTIRVNLVGGFVAALVALAWTESAGAAERARDVSVERSGNLRFGFAGGFHAAPLVNYGNWSNSMTANLSTKDACAFVLTSSGKKAGEGSWSLTARPDGSVLVTNRFTLARDVQSQACGVRLYLPFANWTGMTWRAANGKSGVFPADQKRAGLFSGTVDSIVLERLGERVVLTFPEKRAVQMSNDAAWCDAFSVRLQRPGTFKAGEPVVTVFAISVSRALTCGIAEPILAKRGPDWVPMTMKRGIVPGGATDFSCWHLVDAPAGKHGWLKRAGDRLVFADNPDKAVRFYGVNLVSSCCWPEKKADADDMVARLVRSGYNTVRLHHIESAGGIATTKEDPSSTTLNAARMDQMDYLVSRLIAAGLYVTIDLYSYRTATWRSLGIDREGSPTFMQMKTLIHLTDAGFENWRTYAANLLNHVNPYTGRAYKDEPGLPLISLVNEAHLRMSWPVVRELDCVRQLFGRDVSKLSIGQIPEFNRVAAEVEERSCARMIPFLRQLGVKALLTDLNNGPYDEPELDPVRQKWFDVNDNHFYVDHPHWLGVRLHLPFRNRNINILDYPRSPLDSAVERQPAGAPYTITEWNFSGPAEYRHQGGLLTGATAIEHGWDGLWAFTWAHGIASLFDDRAKSGIGNFDILLDPIQQANERAMVALYLRGDDEADGKSALAKHPERKCFTVDTPRTQGGAALASDTFETADLRVKLAQADAAVWATSVDGEPLVSSRRILVTHATDVQNEDTFWADPKRTIVLSRGKRQLLAHVGRAEVSLRLGSGAWTCYALATDGTRIGKVACAVHGDRLDFVADVARDPHAATLLYELVRE